jgi:hypothetical protein
VASAIAASAAVASAIASSAAVASAVTASAGAACAGAAPQARPLRSQLLRSQPQGVEDRRPNICRRSLAGTSNTGRSSALHWEEFRRNYLALGHKCCSHATGQALTLQGRNEAAQDLGSSQFS